jgi:hypothetical protein
MASPRKVSGAALESPSVVQVRRPKRIREDDDTLIQGLTPAQVHVLAQKVYDLLLDELRLEAERYGRSHLR